LCGTIFYYQDGLLECARLEWVRPIACRRHSCEQIVSFSSTAHTLQPFPIVIGERRQYRRAPNDAHLA